MEDFCIRPAEEGDIPVLLCLIRELACYEKLLDSVEANETSLGQWLFDGKTAEALMLEYSGECIGYAIFFHNFSTFKGRPGLYLEDVYIRPDYRRRGFGKSVLVYLAMLAVERGCWGLEWTCLDWNTPSQRFYESIGAVHRSDWMVYRLQGGALLDMVNNQ